MLTLAACSANSKTEVTAGAPACPANKVVGWGDSLTYSLTKVDGEWRQANPTWLDTVGQDLHIDTENFGVPSQGSAEIAVRQGGLKPLLTLRSDRIPSGSVAAIPVTAIRPRDGWTQYAEAGTMSMRGTLAGVSGVLQHAVKHGFESFAFVPDESPTSDVAVSANSMFSSDDGAEYRGCTQIIWAGTNDGAQKSAILHDIAGMVDWLHKPKRYVIVGTVPSVEKDLAITYGSRFVDLRSWLISDGLAATGILPTPDDAAAIAAGEIPPSLTVDGTHLTQLGYTTVGHHLASAIRKVG